MENNVGIYKRMNSTSIGGKENWQRPERENNMKKEIFYVMTDGYTITRHEIEMAFYVTHGYYNTCKHEQEFLKWLYSLLGKTIKQAIPECDIQVEKLAKSSKFLAIKLYRERYKCTLREAVEYIESLDTLS